MVSQRTCRLHGGESAVVSIFGLSGISAKVLSGAGDAPGTLLWVIQGQGELPMGYRFVGNGHGVHGEYGLNC